MASTEVQTEKQVEELPKKNKRYENTVSNQGRSMNTIKEDGDEEMAL